MELLFPLLILALLVPTFLGIRRQKKEMQKTAELQDALHVGDRVMTTAGLHATPTGSWRRRGTTSRCRPATSTGPANWRAVWATSSRAWPSRSATG